LSASGEEGRRREGENWDGGTGFGGGGAGRRLAGVLSSGTCGGKGGSTLARTALLANDEVQELGGIELVTEELAVREPAFVAATPREDVPFLMRGFRVLDLGFRVHGLGFRVSG